MAAVHAFVPGPGGPHAAEHREVTSYYKIHAFTPRPLPLRQIWVTDGRHAS